MKKKSIFVVLLLTMTMLVTGCGGQKTLDGTWVGKLDVTKQFEDGIKTANPDLAEFVDFEDLIFTMDISFAEEQMEMTVTQESIDSFNANFAKGMQNMAVGYWESGLSTMDITLEEAIAESGMTEEQYLERIYKETGIDKMIASMTEVTTDTINKLSGMKGTYTTPVKDELRLYYAEDTFESMEYGFKGKNLNITIKGEGFSLWIQCERAK